MMTRKNEQGVDGEIAFNMLEHGGLDIPKICYFTKLTERKLCQLLKKGRDVDTRGFIGNDFGEIEKILSRLRAIPGFCSEHKSPNKDISVEIANLGVLQFPLSRSQEKKLIEMAEPAPFGYKEKTLYDPEIRNAW